MPYVMISAHTSSVPAGSVHGKEQGSRAGATEHCPYLAVRGRDKASAPRDDGTACIKGKGGKSETDSPSIF